MNYSEHNNSTKIVYLQVVIVISKGFLGVSGEVA